MARIFLFFVFLSGLFSSAWALVDIGIISSTQDQTCLGTRAGGPLNCTANEFTVITSFSAAAGTPPFCVAGESFDFLVDLQLSGSKANRYNVGFFVGQNGNIPGNTVTNTSPNLCSVNVFPVSPLPWNNATGDVCGDLQALNNAAPPYESTVATINKIKVKCQVDTASGGSDLVVPYTISWFQNTGGNFCSGPGDVFTDTTSKCQSGLGKVNAVNPVKVGAYVDVTKATLPAGNTAQSFVYRVTGPIGAKVGTKIGTVYTSAVINSAADGINISIKGGETARFFIDADATTSKTLTITEAATPGWESTANAISCTPIAGTPSITTSLPNRSIAANLSATNNAASCTITNQQSSKITLTKTVSGRVSSTDQFTVSASGGGTLQGSASATTVGAATSAATTFYSSPGVALTLADVAAGTTVLNNYDARLTCTNALSGTPGYTLNSALPNNVSTTSASITPAAGDDISCTYTNTPKPRITLNKAISAAGGGRVRSTDQFVLAVTGATSVTTTGTGNAVTSAPVSLVATAGVPITLSETAAPTTPATSLGNYITTYACTNSGTGGTVVTSGTGTSFTFTPVNNDVVACTFTNARKSATLALRKTWVSGVSGDTATVGSSGFINNASSGLSTSSGNNTTTGSTVTVYAGETGTLSEVFGIGASTSYTPTLVCTGNATPLSGSSLTVDAADTAIVCTLTNTKKSRITLAKTVGGRVSGTDQFTVSASGGGTLSGTSFATTSGAGASATTTFFSSPGAALTLADVAAGTTVLSNYESRLTCTNALSGTAGYTLNASLPNNASTTSASFTPLVGDDISCTYTNTPKPRITLNKAISAAGGGRVRGTDQFVLAMTGATPVTTTGTGTAVTSAPVALVATAGVPITLSETAAPTTPATSLANYVTTYACTNSGSGGTVVTSGTGTSLTFTPANNDVMACTFTNTRKIATLALRKTWVAGVSGDTATVTSAGFVNTASSGLSTSSGNNTTTGSAVTVYAGETGSLSEAFGVGAAASYSASLACTGNTTPLSGNSLTIASADSAIVCTFTNAGVRINLAKTVGGRVSSTDQFTVSASGGGTLQGTASATTVGAAASATTTFYSSPGVALTLSDAAAGTTVLSDYESRLTCTNALSGTDGYTLNSTLPNNASTTSASFTPLAGDDISCAYTNTPKPRITLNKVISAAGGGRVSSTDQFVLAMTGATSVTTTGAGNSVASAPVSMVATAGVPITLSETAASTTPATSLGNYTTTYACTNSGTGGTVVTSGTGTSFTFTPVNNDVLACTFTNTRKSATLALRKTWVSGVSGDTATVTSSGFINNASSGLSTSSGNNTTTGSTATVYAGETGAIGEVFGTGAAASYAASLACTGNAAPLSGNSLTIAPADSAIVCTFTNMGTPPPSRLNPNGAQTAQPGTAVFYAHNFYAGSDGQVTFSLTNVATPTGWPWNQVLYRDSNCNGALDASEPNIAAPITLAAAQTLCLIVKQFVPAGIALGAQNTTTLSASYTSAIATVMLSVVDVTTVADASALVLSKRVSNITQGGASGITSNANPGETLQYTLTAVNNGSVALSALFINDATPAFTTYLSAACPVTLPAVITACTVSVQPAVGTPGSVQWTFTGVLAPSGQLTVSYQVKVNQ
jgi:hypothetical protein